MPKPKRSPIPHIITDAELAQFRGLSLHKKVRKDGTLAVDVLYRDPFTGYSRSKTVDAVRDAILDCLNELATVVSTKRPEVVRDPKTPFHDVVLGWFADAAENGYTVIKSDGNPEQRWYSPSTLNLKSQVYETHVFPAFGHKAVGCIAKDDLELFFQTLVLRGVGAHAIEKTQGLLKHNVFPWAKREGYIIVDPAQTLTPRTAKSPVRKKDFFTTKHVAKLLDIRTLETLAEFDPDKPKHHWVKHATYYLVHLMALLELGVRIGELAGIRWSDFWLSDEPNESYVEISRTRLQDYHDRTKEPKSEAGERTIFMSDELANALRHHREHQYDLCANANILYVRRHKKQPEPPNPNDYVFTTPYGRPIDIKTFRRQFKRICAEAGIDNLGTADKKIPPHPHTTRHTFFTHMKEAGVPQDTFMDVGGHSDPRATMRYMGTTDEARREASEKYRKRLGRDSKNTT